MFVFVTGWNSYTSSEWLGSWRLYRYAWKTFSSDSGSRSNRNSKHSIWQRFWERAFVLHRKVCVMIKLSITFLKLKCSTLWFKFLFNLVSLMHWKIKIFLYIYWIKLNKELKGNSNDIIYTCIFMCIKIKKYSSASFLFNMSWNR